MRQSDLAYGVLKAAPAAMDSSMTINAMPRGN
jgi:hypothetical protein